METWLHPRDSGLIGLEEGLDSLAFKKCPDDARLRITLWSSGPQTLVSSRITWKACKHRLLSPSSPDFLGMGPEDVLFL